MDVHPLPGSRAFTASRMHKDDRVDADDSTTFLRVIEERLATFGGTLADIVTMTVYIGDTRYGDPFIDIRATKFEPGHYPSSALVTVVGFARPGILLEVKATAVVGGS